jgi:hypothetical protein
MEIGDLTSPLVSSSVEPVEKHRTGTFSTAVLDKLEPALEANGYLVRPGG